MYFNRKGYTTSRQGNRFKIIVHQYIINTNQNITTEDTESTEKSLSKMIIVYLLLQVSFSGKSLSPFCTQIQRSFALQ